MLPIVHIAPIAHFFISIILMIDVVDNDQSKQDEQKSNENANFVCFFILQTSCLLQVACCEMFICCSLFLFNLAVSDMFIVE